MYYKSLQTTSNRLLSDFLISLLVQIIYGIKQMTLDDM